MTARESNLLWLKDLLDNLQSCRQQLAWAENNQAVLLITETMIRDLESCRRLCDAMQRQARPRRAV